MALSDPSGLLSTLDSQAVILASTGIAILCFIVYSAAQWYRLSHIPGPFLASVSSLWAYRSMKSLRFQLAVQKVQEEYGKVVRIGPNALLVSDPETIWRINSARSAYSRGGWYACNRINPYGNSIFTDVDSARHDKRKAKLLSGFQGKGLVDLEGSLDTQLGMLVDVLRKRTAGHGQGQAVLDIGRTLQYFQVDLITFAGMGEAWGDLPDNKDHFQFLAAGEEQVAFVHGVGMIPSLRHIIFSPLFLRWFGPDPTKGWLGVLHQAVKQRAHGEKANEQGGDMLDEWLKHGLSPTEAELDLSLQVPAGTETSISTIRGILLYLMTTPCVYQKVKQEISAGIHDGRISSPIKNDEAKKLPYLQAVIDEGMRIASPVTAGFGKAVPRSGDVICGKSIPAGTEVHMNITAMMQDQEVFGPDTDLFRPERFIECDEATKAKRHKVVELNFGHGRWLCLGKVLAQMEMNKVLVELLRNFDFQVLNPEQPWRKTSTVIMYINDFYARVVDAPIG